MYDNVVGGSDRLVSGTGSADYMWGDAVYKDAAAVGGLDVFVFAPNNGQDVMYDLEQGKDHIDLELAREFGATEVVSERGEEAIERVRALTGGFGVQSVLECVGTEQAIDTSMSIVRPGGAVGRVGVPHYEAIPGAQQMFYRNVIVAGGPAPVRAYIAELLHDVMEGRIEPGRVFDRTVGLDGVPDGYRAMNEREALKVMVRP
jgi:threonine dehydrogenase-like Zn-dependent dehydrogenase